MVANMHSQFGPNLAVFSACVPPALQKGWFFYFPICTRWSLNGSRMTPDRWRFMFFFFDEAHLPMTCVSLVSSPYFQTYICLCMQTDNQMSPMLTDWRLNLRILSSFLPTYWKNDKQSRIRPRHFCPFPNLDIFWYNMVNLDSGNSWIFFDPVYFRIPETNVSAESSSHFILFLELRRSTKCA